MHILSNEQEALSNKFAKKGEDKFAGITLEQGVTRSPLLPGCSARFQCKTMFEYDGGDHIIFVGEVLAYDQNPTPPLLYLSGNYALATKKTNAIATEPVAADQSADRAPALFSEDLLGYLLGRAHYQFFHAIRPAMQAYGLSEADFFTLSVLSVREQVPAHELDHLTAYTGASVGADLLNDLVRRQLANATDAGTPALSDPGAVLVRRAREAGITVTAVPGASALATALSLAGLGASDFYFGAFLPATAKARQQALRKLADFSCPLIFYEAPHRIHVCLKDMLEIFGERQAQLFRELTKLHEEHLFGTLSELCQRVAQGVKGELVLVVAGCEQTPAAGPEDIAAMLRQHRDVCGSSLKEAVSETAQTLDLPRTRVYRAALGIWQEKE